MESLTKRGRNKGARGSTPRTPTTMMISIFNIVMSGRPVREDRTAFNPNPLKMTEKDLKLIETARNLTVTSWEKAVALSQQAETEEARKIILGIAHDLHHREEFLTGMQ